MALTEPPGEFDYLLDELNDADEDALDDDYFDNDPYQPPRPWYRTTAAMVAIGAMGVAVIAILVSAVLLVSRHSRGTTDNVEPTIATTTPSSAPATTPPMVATAPPSPPVNPTPSGSTASAPVVVAPPSHSEPTKPPQVGVTRGPLIRQPISVRPVPRKAFPGY
jgi:hypothetical protein